ncbi:MAG: NADH-quinone oxidoreductase subunit L [Dissulfurispiraceae bacterium]|jgi:NADH-quinone oxidoreductase subunit L|nr:NADH-quinone oxidoreductase subunit L [Dissulfurispiraceae bacterium]
MLNYALIPLLPLLAFAVNILFRNVMGRRAHLVALPAVIGSFILSLSALADVQGGTIINQDLYSWIVSGSFRASVGFLIDQLTAVMLIVVTSISMLVHFYSVGYMHDDEGYARFFSYLSLFTFSMLMLVMSNNLLQLYFGWEAVGLCSYLLIGFWYEKKSAADAGKKAFIVNRFGDFGFALGILLIFVSLGTVHYADIFSGVGSLQGSAINIAGFNFDLITLIALLLFCGAVGKSAQMPLHVWLPDAMEGPTPVSALIHAATMVTAGVFMIARFNPVFTLSDTAMAVVAIVGASTSLFAATIALVQNDIKRIIAYSTVSQLGYMVLACGVGAFGAGIFHLFTHAYFKALLFLGAGSVMHAMAGNVDIQKMGGLKKYMPATYWTFLIASLSIAGVPGLAGFFSKDEILWLTYNSGALGKVLWASGTLVAALTAFYSFRIIFVAFHGEFRGTSEDEHHLHESPKVMTIPLILLAVGAVAAGWFGIPEAFGGSNLFARFLAPVVGHPEITGSHLEEMIVVALSIIAALCGIGLAYFFYVARPCVPVILAGLFRRAHSLLWNKYYIDEIYDAILIKPFKWIASYLLARVSDGKIIEGLVNGVPSLIRTFGDRLRNLQSGNLQHYAFGMVAGLFVILTVIFIAVSR